MNSMSENHKVVWWLLGFFALIVVGGVGTWVNSIERKVDLVAGIQRNRGERISALETVLPYIKERLDSIDRRLEKIEENRPRR